MSSIVDIGKEETTQPGEQSGGKSSLHANCAEVGKSTNPSYQLWSVVREEELNEEAPKY
jgi:hypothetical protein